MHKSKHDAERFRRRQEFDETLAKLETDLGFRAPPQAPVYRPSRSLAEWQANPAAELHPYLTGHPGIQLGLMRHDHQHQLRFQEHLYDHEKAMQQRAHHIAIKQARGERTQVSGARFTCFGDGLNFPVSKRFKIGYLNRSAVSEMHFKSEFLLWTTELRVYTPTKRTLIAISACSRPSSTKLNRNTSKSVCQKSVSGWRC
jgi:hypothetical protein